MNRRTLTDEQTNLRRNFLDFLNWDIIEEKYATRINQCLTRKAVRLIVDLEDLLDYYPTSAARAQERSLGHIVLENPNLALPLFEMALAEIALRKDIGDRKEGSLESSRRRMRIGLRGCIGSILSPRELYASCAKHLVAVRGVVTRVSPPRCRVVETVHYCAETGRYTRRKFRDALESTLDNDLLPAINVMPRKDNMGNLLRTEFGLGEYRDVQTFTLQESPEFTPPGQLPRSVEVRVDEDMVDKVKSGDRVTVLGIYQPYVREHSGKKDFDTVLLAKGLTPSQEKNMTEISGEDREKIHKLSSDPYIFTILAQSLAPSVYGRLEVKKGIILMLAGGVERAAKETHIRGDINILLVGEPATAKSQLMRFVYQLAPLAIHTTGKGSTGVGLTAAVIQDSESRERSLCAGAMVLADRGVLLVDEFDKMNSYDRVAMHEAMEQQTITITKAGIHASINARCSVMAAANPLFGYYSTAHSLSTNLGLPETLLSRFDLTFLLLDGRGSVYTRKLADYVLENHMKSVSLLSDVSTTSTTGSSEEIRIDAAEPEDKTHRLQVSMLRKYLLVAREIYPVFSTVTAVYVSELYAKLREVQNEIAETEKKDALHVSPRTLESLIRLSTAHARIRLSAIVTELDAEVAYGLVKKSIFSTLTAQEERKEDLKSWEKGKKETQPKTFSSLLRSPIRLASAGENQENWRIKPTTTQMSAEITKKILDSLRGLHEYTGHIKFPLHEVQSAVQHENISLEHIYHVIKRAHTAGSVIFTENGEFGDEVTLIP